MPKTIRPDNDLLKAVNRTLARIEPHPIIQQPAPTRYGRFQRLRKRLTRWNPNHPLLTHEHTPSAKEPA